jgi:hypothetical protein
VTTPFLMHFRASGLRRLPIVTAVLCAACGVWEGPSGESGSGEVEVLSSDPQLRELVASLLPGLSEGAGLPLRSAVRVESRSREELLQYVEERLDRDLPAREAMLTAEAYALLGLAPPGLDLRALLVEVYQEQVAGFYDPASSTLFVLDDQPASALEPLLLHELVHAIQDQHVSLDSLTAPERGNDRRMAARAAIEGHATLVMLAWMTGRREGRAVAPEELPALAELLRPDAATLAAQYPALAGAPRVFQESLLFPYVEGAAFVQALWRGAQGRAAPFGDRLPLSTEQVMFTGRTGGQVDPPVEVTIVPPEGFRFLLESTMGALETGIFVEELTGVRRQAPISGWGGDRWALLEGPGDTRGLLWVTVWDSEGARDGFVARVEPGLERLGAGARLERATIDGRAGAVLRVGVAPSILAAEAGAEAP